MTKSYSHFLFLSFPFFLLISRFPSSLPIILLASSPVPLLECQVKIKKYFNFYFFKFLLLTNRKYYYILNYNRGIKMIGKYEIGVKKTVIKNHSIIHSLFFLLSFPLFLLISQFPTPFSIFISDIPTPLTRMLGQN